MSYIAWHYDATDEFYSNDWYSWFSIVCCSSYFDDPFYYMISYDIESITI